MNIEPNNIYIYIYIIFSRSSLALTDMRNSQLMTDVRIVIAHNSRVTFQQYGNGVCCLRIMIWTT